MIRKLFALMVLAGFSLAINDEEVNYYTDLISSAYKNAQTYEWPTNAYQYHSTGKLKKFGSYDFVVIGAGSAGSVIANRLSEINNWSVLVLEAGSYGNNLTNIPGMFAPAQLSSYNWGFNSTPQTTCCLGNENHVCFYPRGKGVGGSSLLNSLVYARGYKWDFNIWANMVNDNRWGWNSVLNYFKKSENFEHNDRDAPFDSNFHGTDGNLHVEFHKPRSPQLNAFLEANKELGFDVVDYNSNKLGVSPSQLNTLHGERFDTGKAFLLPVQNRTNLKILTNSYVTKIRFCNRETTTGVEFSHNGESYFVKAKKEVIISAGAIGTPQILMLSGIGPKEHLKELGIEVLADLKIGNTLRDNSAFFGITVSTNYTEPVKPLQEYVKKFLQGTGSLTIPSNKQGVGFYESSYTKGKGIPEIELQFVAANATNEATQRSFGFTDKTYKDLWKNMNVPQSCNIYPIVLHAKSVGTLKLKSKNPYDYPLINANFISDSENRDINTLYEGIQLALSLLETKAFKAMNATLQSRPLKACKQFKYLSKDYWFCALKQLTINLYHPMGTCPMGTDPKKGAVVDSKLKVFGFKNLRIADASVFPLVIAGHPHAATVMIGEQLADLVKSWYKRKNV